VISSEQNSKFVAQMNDLLEVYRRPCDPECPVVWLDDQPTQLVRRAPPSQPNRDATRRDDFDIAKKNN
jgi:hypothetical protein